MMQTFTPARLALAMAAAFPLPTLAENAARVEFTAGAVRAVAADGSSRALTRGAQVAAGDMVDTGSGRAQMRFTDGSLVSLQPQTQFRIEQYAFAGKPDEDRGFFNLIKGGLRTITGLVGKTNRSNYKLTTSVATIGIRGTEFSVAYGNSINVTTGAGAVDICNSAGCLTAEDGQSVYVANEATPPVLIEVKTDLPPPPPSKAVDLEPPVINEVFLVSEERDAEGDLVVLDGLDPHGELQSGDGYYVYGQYTDQYGGYGGSVMLNGVTATIGSNGLSSADDGDGGLLTAGSIVQGSQDGIISWGRWAGATCSNLGCGGANIADMHYVAGQPTSDLAALGGINATYSLSGATTPTTQGGTFGGTVVSGSLSADFSHYSVAVALTIDASAATFDVAGSGWINSSNASFSGSIGSCTGCGSTPNGSFHGFFAGPAAERAGLVYTFDGSVGGIGKVAGAAVFTQGAPNQGNY